MDLAAFSRLVEAGRVPPVVLLHGPDPFLVVEAAATASRILVPDELAPWSREVLDAREAGAEGIVRAALTLPAAGPRRVVVARAVEALGPRPCAALVEYLSAPNPATVLLLAAGVGLGAGHWLLKGVDPAAVVAASPPTGRALVGWLRARAAAHGVEVTERAAALLVELLGEDPGALAAEVDKAALAGGPGNRRVTEAEVRAVVSEQRVRDIFELTRALEQGDYAAALAVSSALLDAGEEPLALLGLLAREVRTLASLQGEGGAERRPEELASALRRPPRAVAALLAQARMLEPRVVQDRLARCWEVERRLKSGGQAKAELALLLAELCGG